MEKINGQKNIKRMDKSANLKKLEGKGVRSANEQTNKMALRLSPSHNYLSVPVPSSSSKYND